MDKKLINIVKGDINTAILNGSYNRNTAYQTNIEFNTPTKLILLDGDPYSNPSLTKVTWQKLKDLRDNNKLVAGSLYRITNYNCTTTQENTRSAGHQFDIVLLALSNNKLAEEGWAMMHDNIYDVVFNDGKTIKCHVFYEEGNQSYDLVDCITNLGTIVPDFIINIDEASKTITSEEQEFISSLLDTPNIGYNYFQNSNLSAWKVWYCLDNDKSRFAWADDRVDEDSPASITGIGGKGEIHTLHRDTADDLNNLFAWKEGVGMQVYTASQTPSVGDTIYDGNGVSTELTLSSFTPAHEGTGLPNGRGVIYRLIDEFNNDIKYDFKNVQFKRTITDGQYDKEGTATWCYTLNVWYNNVCQDASIVGNTLLDDEGYIEGVYGNKFGYTTAYNLYLKGVGPFAFALGDNVVLSSVDGGGSYFGIYSNTIGNASYSNTIGGTFQCNMIGNDFQNNTIVDTFSSNTIGNSFKGKRFDVALTYANYGNNGVELATKS